MTQLKNLLQLTRPTLMADAASYLCDGWSVEDATESALTALYTDDTFNEYSETELQAAISEIITDF